MVIIPKNRLDKFNSSTADCNLGCDLKSLIKIDNQANKDIIFICENCYRKYGFNIGFDSYPEGDVIYSVLTCVDKTSREEGYDDQISIVLREHDEDQNSQSGTNPPT